MGDRLSSALARSRGCGGRSCAAPARAGRDANKADWLEQMLLAVRDIADRDDIHQAAARLALVQEWIRREAERAAADPIFAELRAV
jgi:hypothetical protein